MECRCQRCSQGSSSAHLTFLSMASRFRSQIPNPLKLTVSCAWWLVLASAILSLIGVCVINAMQCTGARSVKAASRGSAADIRYQILSAHLHDLHPETTGVYHTMHGLALMYTPPWAETAHATPCAPLLVGASSIPSLQDAQCIHTAYLTRSIARTPPSEIHTVCAWRILQKDARGRRCNIRYAYPYKIRTVYAYRNLQGGVVDAGGAACDDVGGGATSPCAAARRRPCPSLYDTVIPIHCVADRE